MHDPRFQVLPVGGVKVVLFTDSGGKRWTLIERSDFFDNYVNLPSYNPNALFLVWDMKGVTIPTEVKDRQTKQMRPMTEEEQQAYLMGLWGDFAVDPDGTGRKFVSGRIDRRFREGYSEEDGGYSRIAIREQPGDPAPTDGTQKRIGAILIHQRSDGKLRVERNAVGSLSDPTQRLRLPRASNSNQAALPGKHLGWMVSNDQVIKAGVADGQIEVLYAQGDFPDDQAMTPSEIRASAIDGLSLAALAKFIG